MEAFIFPAMGSHGGATVKGQMQVLESLLVTEETVGCPILSTMETVCLGKTIERSLVYVDKYAAKADGVILCGRVKAHTAFWGIYESGLLKMAVIGMGNERGAESVHESGFMNMGRVMPQFARVIFDNMNIIAGLGIIENAFEPTCRIAGMTAQEIWEQGPELLREAKRRMGRIWLREADVDITYPNVATSTLVHAVKRPVFTHTDENAVKLAVRLCNGIDKQNPRIVRIKNSLDLEYIWVSEALIDTVRVTPNMELAGGAGEWGFGERGNLW